MTPYADTKHRDEVPALRLPRLYLTGVIVLAAFQAASLVAFLLLLRAVIDALGSADPDPILIRWSVVALIGAVLINVLSRSGEFWLSENMGYEQIRRLRMAMYSHLQGMSPRQIQGRARGGLLLRFTGDLSMLRTWVSRGIGRGLASLIILAAGLATIATLNRRIALVMAAILIAGAAVTVELGPRLRRVTKWVRRKRSLLTSNVDEQVHSLAVVQVFGRSKGEYNRLSRQNDSLIRSLFRTSRLRAWMLGAATAAGWLAVVAVVWVGSLEVIAGRTTVGVVVTAILAARHLAGPVRRLGLSYDYWQRAAVSRGKILDFMGSSSRSLDESGLSRLTVSRGDIELRNVTVDGALTDLSLTVPGGRMIAIMGVTGAGKSTLLSVISGLENPDSGEVLIDGQSLSTHTLSSRFRRVGMVSPDLPLMRGTVARNLTYRHPSATPEEIERIIRTCHLDTLLARFPDGLQTWLYEGGRNISVGERQRIALGRALMGNPPLLLLDEPTSGLDPVTKEVFRTVLSHHHGTVLMVTHDPDEAGMADEVWYMHEGRFVDDLPRSDGQVQSWLSAHTDVNVH